MKQNRGGAFSARADRKNTVQVPQIDLLTLRQNRTGHTQMRIRYQAVLPVSGQWRGALMFAMYNTIHDIFVKRTYRSEEISTGR